MYNRFLARRQESYRETGKGLTRFQCDKELTDLKRGEDTAWLRDVDKFALQQAVRDLDRAFENFFRDCRKPKKERRFGYPNFKSKKGVKQSYRTNFTNGNIAVAEDRLKLPKLGWVKFRKSQEVQGRIISLRVL